MSKPGAWIELTRSECTEDGATNVTCAMAIVGGGTILREQTFIRNHPAGHPEEMVVTTAMVFVPDAVIIHDDRGCPYISKRVHC